MTQVIEVRFLHPETGERLHQAFIDASTHTEAITLAYTQFPDSASEDLKKIYQDPDYEQGKRVSGAQFAWKYIYRCEIKNPDEGGPDLSMLAVLFASYKEKVE